jgi:hypothetical protein
MVHDHLLDREHIAQFRTLILPNIAALSDSQCQQIRDFVHDGGSVVATFETSLYDEWGVRRKDFGLGPLFGVTYAGRVQGPMLNSYLSVQGERDTNAPHLLLAGFEDATRIINAAHQVEVKPLNDKMFSPLEIVPSYPDLPMEAVFPPPAKAHDPALFMSTFGRGRAVYFPGDIDRTFWEVLDVDLAKLLRNAVLWATNEIAPVTVEGFGVVDVAVWGQKDSMTIHLVNLTNPMMMKGPIREVIPLGEQRLRVQIPDQRRVKQAKLLVSGKNIPFNIEHASIILDVPSIAIHEVVALDFAV